MVVSMGSRWRRGAASLLAVTLLLSFGAALAEDAFFHTDDGCAVERHCLACRWHQGTTASPAAITAPQAALEPGALVGRSAPITLLEVAPPETPSRAPPLA